MKKEKRFFKICFSFMAVLMLSLSILFVCQVKGTVHAAGEVTDLTNTTWKFKGDGKCNSCGDGSSEVEFHVNWECEYASYQYSGSSIVTPCFDEVSSLNTISFWDDEQGAGIMYLKEEDYYYDGLGEGWYYDEPGGYQGEKGTGEPILTITGGADVNNSDLINWLYANAELQVDEPSTGVVADIVLPSILALTFVGLIAMCVLGFKKHNAI